MKRTGIRTFTYPPLQISIPGGNARASLKLPKAGPLPPEPPGSIPGGNARASLKGRVLAAGDALLVPSIPGGNARASLKRARPDQVLVAGEHHRSIPGGNARASLKR